MTINLQRRKAVMGRSIRLGHCVCNPRQGCPCPTLKDHNVCPCAGEKMPVRTDSVRLTRHVRRAGCASKIGQADLLRILKHLPPVTDPNVLVGAAAGDDAGVYRLDDNLALVQTVDVFTPVVDDPYLFGQIAAANSLSDVYAMGGRPLTALSIIGFPIDELDGAIMQAILAGGMEKLAEAGCALLGGHSIHDEEIKCGFAVTGLVHPAQAVERGRARPGDALVLTKPLGTGMVGFAAQIGRASEAALAEVGRFMATLNKDAAELMTRYEAHACTDVTGFGLAGHLAEMARTSGAVAEIDMTALPVLASAARCIELGIFSGAIEKNQEYSMAWVLAQEGPDEGPDEGADDRNLSILYDPQTSGGLLIALPPEAAAPFVEDLSRLGHAGVAVIGRIAPAKGRQPGQILVTHDSLKNLVGEKEKTIMSEPQKDLHDDPSPAARPEESAGAPECCSGGAGTAASDAEAANLAGMFGDFMKAANAEGLIDKRAKKLMAIALSVAQRCKPCLAIHIKGALAMGLTRAEIDEAAYLAIAFAGCPALMLYKEVWAEVNQK